MQQRSFFTLGILSMLLACAGSRDHSVRKLAQQIGKAENQLKNRTVAVMTPEFRGQSDEAEARELAEQLTHELVSSSSLRVAERSRLKDVLKEQELLQQGIADPATAARLGRLLLVDAVLIGSITGKGDRTEVFLRLVDSETALILKTAKGELPAGLRQAVVRSKTYAPTKQNVREKPKTTTDAIAPTTSTSTKADAGNIEQADEAQGRLIDLSYRKAGAGGYHQVIGRVENFGKIALNSPMVSLQHYDSTRALIGGSPCSSPDQPVLPGQKLPFSCLFKPAAGFARYEASLDLRSTLFASKSLELSATGLKFRPDAGSITADYQLSGILRNDAEFTVTYPRILVSVFDASGKFIGSGYGFSVKKELPPGESSPFAISVHSYSLHGKAARYEAFYSALPTRR